MKIVVHGHSDKTTNSIENIENDTYYYVNGADEAIEALKFLRAEILVLENGANTEKTIKEIIAELNQLPQEVKIIALSPSLNYYIVANKTLNSSINHYILNNNNPIPE